MSDHDRNEIEETIPLKQGSPLDISLSMREDQLYEENEDDPFAVIDILEAEEEQDDDDLDEDELFDEDDDDPDEIDDGIESGIIDSLDDIEW